MLADMPAMQSEMLGSLYVIANAIYRWLYVSGVIDVLSIYEFLFLSGYVHPMAFVVSS